MGESSRPLEAGGDDYPGKADLLMAIETFGAISHAGQIGVSYGNQNRWSRRWRFSPHPRWAQKFGRAIGKSSNAPRRPHRVRWRAHRLRRTPRLIRRFVAVQCILDTYGNGHIRLRHRCWEGGHDRTLQHLHCGAVQPRDVTAVDQHHICHTAGTDTVTNASGYLSPYHDTEYEIGAKYALTPSLLLTVDGFRITRPYAANVFTNATTSTFEVVGQQRNYGIETFAQGDVTPALSVFGGVTYIDAQLMNTGVASTNGKLIIGVPHFKTDIAVDYHPAFMDGFAVTGAVHYEGAWAATNTNNSNCPGLCHLGSRRALHDDVHEPSHDSALASAQRHGHVLLCLHR